MGAGVLPHTCHNSNVLNVIATKSLIHDTGDRGTGVGNTRAELSVTQVAISALSLSYYSQSVIESTSLDPNRSTSLSLRNISTTPCKGPSTWG